QTVATDCEEVTTAEQLIDCLEERPCTVGGSISTKANSQDPDDVALLAAALKSMELRDVHKDERRRGASRRRGKIAMKDEQRKKREKRKATKASAHPSSGVASSG
ncbi:unnamed protein product, partial [Amoebophrya sp. A25]